MKKILTACGLIFGITAILLTILLVRNPSKQNYLAVLTAEETAIRHVKGMTEAGIHIDRNTVEAIQQVKMDDITLVLVQYSGHRMRGDVELCEFVVETKKTLSKSWQAKGGAGLCHENNDPANTIPITVVSSYGTTTLLNRGYSTAFGYLRNGEITKVVVTWEDGLMQPASVSGSTYLTVREGRSNVEKIETYNHLGEIVYTSQIIPTQRESNE